MRYTRIGIETLGIIMQQPIELILSRQWASYLDFPVWLYNEKGILIYYNEAAEHLLGLHTRTIGEITAKDLKTVFKCTSLEEPQNLLDPMSTPVNIALFQHRPAHKKFKIFSLDGVWKEIESTAFPIVGQGGKQLGAISIFWEIKIS